MRSGLQGINTKGCVRSSMSGQSVQSQRRVQCRGTQLENRPTEQPNDIAVESSSRVSSGEPSKSNGSISSISTSEWEERYAADGCVDLWVEEEFNSGSRVVGGRTAHQGERAGTGGGEGPSKGNVKKHNIKIFNHHTDQELDVTVPEDRYILFEAEDQGLLLPWACRMGCCTTCAVKVLEGEVYQPQSLGVSKELKDQGYALMCVAYPQSDAVLQTVEEDEVYDLQFGKAFAERALQKGNRDAVERDDFALEMANMDE